MGRRFILSVEGWFGPQGVNQSSEWSRPGTLILFQDGLLVWGPHKWHPGRGQASPLANGEDRPPPYPAFAYEEECWQLAEVFEAKTAYFNYKLTTVDGRHQLDGDGATVLAPVARYFHCYCSVELDLLLLGLRTKRLQEGSSNKGMNGRNDNEDNGDGSGDGSDDGGEEEPQLGYKRPRFNSTPESGQSGGTPAKLVK